MAVVTSSYPTLADIASRLDADGKVAPIAEVLSQDLPILKDLGWKECNMTDGYLHTIRTGLPTPTWRRLYQGVQPSKSTTAQVKDVCGNLESYSDIDKDVADLNGNTAAFRFSEDSAQIEGMAQELGRTLFYGNVKKEPDKFEGLANRYSTLDETKAKSAHNVVSASAANAGDDGLTSLYFINLDAFHGIYPKGSVAGLQKTDKGQVTVTKADGSNLEVYRTHFKQQAGAALEDWRACGRLCNVKISGENQTSGDALINAMIDVKNRIPAKFHSRLKLYVPRDIITVLEKASLDKSKSCLSITAAAGQLTTSFFGIPVEICDAISTAEARVK